MIIPAEEQHLPAIAQLIRRNTEEVIENEYTPAQKAAWINANKVHQLREKCKICNLFCFYQKDMLLGVGGLHGNMVISMYVDYRIRGKGIGKLLLAHIEQFAQDKGLEQLELTATKSAETFYKKKGFVVLEKEVVIVNGVEFPETRMMKVLKP